MQAKSALIPLNPLRSGFMKVRQIPILKANLNMKKRFFILVLGLVFGSLPGQTQAQVRYQDIPYANVDERQMLDVYSKEGSKNLPVVFWIHGGGWQVGDKADVMQKPKSLTDRGFVFVSTNYRLLPSVDMETIVRDIAKSIRWVHDHIAEYGGDSDRIVVAGHSAGAQLAALVCTDAKYLKEQNLSFKILKGCVPVDGDTYDIPAIITTAEIRCWVHKQPQATFGHRQKFGNDPKKHIDFSAVNHVTKDIDIPPFMILFVSDHPDTNAQAQRLGSVLADSNISVQLVAGKNTNHSKINDDLGLANDPSTVLLFEFLDKQMMK